MKKSIGLTLSSLHEKITVDKIEQFQNIVLKWLNQHNLVPTYFSVTGKGFSDKYVKFTPKKLSILSDTKGYLDKDGKVIHGLDFSVTATESDAPSFDAFAVFLIGYREHKSELYLKVLLNPNILNFETHEVGKLIESFVSLFEVDFGFIYEHKAFSHVEAVVLEFDDGKFTQEEYENFLRWYRYSNEEKLRNIRDVFSVNILNKKYYEPIIKHLQNKYKLMNIELNDRRLACLVKPSATHYF